MKKDPSKIIKKIYDYIETHPKVSINDVARDLKVTWRTARKYLKLLVYISKKSPITQVKVGKRQFFITTDLKSYKSLDSQAFDFTFKSDVRTRSRELFNRPFPYPWYMTFVPGKELVLETYGLLCLVRYAGEIAKGTGRVIKVCEEKKAKLVVIAEDVDPPEIVAHLPILCEERRIPYTFVPSKTHLGLVIGAPAPAASCAIVDQGEFTEEMNVIISNVKEASANRSTLASMFYKNDRKDNRNRNF